MAEIILGLLCIAAGAFLLWVALMVAIANGIGGASNPSAINYTPAFICIGLSLAAFAGAFSLLT